MTACEICGRQQAATWKWQGGVYIEACSRCMTELDGRVYAGLSYPAWLRAQARNERNIAQSETRDCNETATELAAAMSALRASVLAEIEQGKDEHREEREQNERQGPWGSLVRATEPPPSLGGAVIDADKLREKLATAEAEREQLRKQLKDADNERLRYADTAKHFEGKWREALVELATANNDRDCALTTNAMMREALVAERQRGAKLLAVVERHWEDGGRDTWEGLKDAIEAYRKGATT